MSIHYSTPRRYKNCHVVSILHGASRGALSNNIHDYGEVVDKLGKGRSRETGYKVKYNSYTSRIMGNMVPGCSVAVIDFKIQGGSYYYPILDVINYGDEGSMDVCGYLKVSGDLIKRYSNYFDSIEGL